MTIERFNGGTVITVGGFSLPDDCPIVATWLPTREGDPTGSPPDAMTTSSTHDPINPAAAAPRFLLDVFGTDYRAHPHRPASHYPI